ncbi:MAG: 4Fe-4S dicluster domain-containing protein [Nitrospirae bacterium]|nr:4Fe-4S dicluster domain-containing protein [Nitrospirota bacterium]MCL5237799.1 4Fe-4S dicluster domain-containing protein [Nitrospirota bacterium]
MNAEPLKEHLKKEGATLVGVGDVTKALTGEIVHLNRGIALAVNRSLGSETVEQLVKLQRAAEIWLKERGFRSLSIPPDSDRIKGKLIARLYKLFSHKTAATCSGLGWIGKNGLLINKRYGPKLSWATVLTNAPLKPDSPVTESLCGNCDLCVRHCPSGAVTGSIWSRREPFKKLVNYERCRSLKTNRRLFEEKPNCGLCVTICPYSRKGLSNKARSGK